MTAVLSAPAISFSPAWLLIILATVFIGFARSYYLAGLFRAPLPNLLVHIHGAVFTSWIVLLTTQTSLVASGRVDLHRRLGLLGFAIACLMVILGVMVATDSMARHLFRAILESRKRPSMPSPLPTWGPS